MFFSAVESFRFDPDSLALQTFDVEREETGQGMLAVRKIVSPYRLATRHDVLYRIDLARSSDNVRVHLQWAVLAFLNGGSSRLRQRVAGTRGSVDIRQLCDTGHFDMGVLFITEPKLYEPVRVCYIPYGSRYPYASLQYRLHDPCHSWIVVPPVD